METPAETNPEAFTLAGVLLVLGAALAPFLIVLALLSIAAASLRCAWEAGA
jgi:hypothetical protein